MLKPYFQEDGIQIFCGDCRAVIPEIIPDVSGVHLLLTDPPWGNGYHPERFAHSTQRKSSAWWKTSDRTAVKPHRPITGNTDIFDPGFLLTFPRLVLWGANWYSQQLPPSGGWLVWDKRPGLEDVEWSMSEAELAWTNICGAIRIFRHRWFGLVRQSEQREHYHPTQKPVALMKWILSRWTKPGDLILDPYMGSGPTLIAAKQLGRRAIGIETSQEYCDIVVNRLSQGVLPLDDAPRPQPLIPQQMAFGD